MAKLLRWSKKRRCRIPSVFDPASARVRRMTGGLQSLPRWRALYREPSPTSRRAGVSASTGDGGPRDRTIFDRPFSVIASLTTPSVRPPALTTPGVAVARSARINPPTTPIGKPLAFSAASVHPSRQPAIISSAPIFPPVRPRSSAVLNRAHLAAEPVAVGAHDLSYKKSAGVVFDFEAASWYAGWCDAVCC
jgi:hypothetical protein